MIGYPNSSLQLHRRRYCVLLLYWRRSPTIATRTTTADYCYTYDGRRLLLHVRRSPNTATRTTVAEYCYTYNGRRLLLHVRRSPTIATRTTVADYCYTYDGRRLLLHVQRPPTTATRTTVADYCYTYDGRRLLLHVRRPPTTATRTTVADSPVRAADDADDSRRYSGGDGPGAVGAEELPGVPVTEEGSHVLQRLLQGVGASRTRVEHTGAKTHVGQDGGVGVDVVDGVQHGLQALDAHDVVRIWIYIYIYIYI